WTESVLAEGTGVQGVVLISDQSSLLAGVARRGVWSAGENPGTPERECSERPRRTLRFRPRAPDQGKMARDAQTRNLRNFQRVQFQFFGNRPARNKADAESCFHCRLDRLGGIEVHHVLERLK